MKYMDKIIHGDCCSVLKKIPSSSIDLTVTSPPYDDLRDYNGYSFDFKAIAKELHRITKDGGVVVWVVSDQTENFSESLTSFKQAVYFVENVGFNLLDTMIYEKENVPPTYPSIRRYAPAFEYMFVFSKGKPKTFNPIKDRPNKYAGVLKKGDTQRQKNGSTKSVRPYTPKKFGIRFNVWRYHVGKGKDTSDDIALDHPARFPEKLAEDHIVSWSNEGDVVLDPMCGSGTACKMAILNNRHFIGIEISKEYVDITRERISNINPLGRYI